MTREKMLDGALRELLSVLEAHPLPGSPYRIVDREKAEERARAALSATEDGAEQRISAALDYCRAQEPLWREGGHTYRDGWADALLAVAALLGAAPAPASPRPEEPGAPCGKLPMVGCVCPHAEKCAVPAPSPRAQPEAPEVKL